MKSSALQSPGAELRLLGKPGLNDNWPLKIAGSRTTPLDLLRWFAGRSSSADKCALANGFGIVDIYPMATQRVVRARTRSPEGGSRNTLLTACRKVIQLRGLLYFNAVAMCRSL